MEKKHYDAAVIGGGPAGYTAALYLSRSGRSTVLFEKTAIGGQMSLTEKIDNYPGFEDGISGLDLSDKMRVQAERFGTETVYGGVEKLGLSAAVKTIQTAHATITADTVILATGAHARLLGIKSEAAKVGKGVSYCATCDGMFYKNKTVAIIGGGNSAVEEAAMLSRLCKHVYLIHRRDTFRAAAIAINAVEKAKNITLVLDSVVTEILGENRVSGVMVQNVKTRQMQNLDLDGVFVSIGRLPDTSLFADQLPLNDDGTVAADEEMRTAIDGVFAAGDVRQKALRQIVTATADGAIAAHFADRYLSEKNDRV